VSQELAEAVRALARANGPIVTIHNGLDLEELPPPRDQRDIDVLIVGVKSPSLAGTIAQQLDAIRVRCLVDPVPRRQLLEAFGRCRVAVTLPERVEGFYLPALEAMAMGAQVVCPDCLGNRSFCVDGWNAFRPAYHLDTIMRAIRDAVTLGDDRRREMASAAAATVRQHTVSIERARFLELLTTVGEVWSTSLQSMPAV
jgi:glycosyltransferase involved in cell wall biosynthesis